MALFAALSYAVTQSGRGGGNIDRETVSLNASDLVQYASLMRSTIDRMRLINGCSDIEISFERDPFDGSDPLYVNPNAPSNFSCHVFHPNGGRVVLRNPINLQGSITSSTIVSDSISFTANNRIVGVGTTDSTTNSNDLVLLYPFLTQNACEEINRGLGISDDIIDNNVTFPTIAGGASFRGSYATVSADIGNELSGADLVGQIAACVNEMGTSSSDGLHFYHVLIER